jgi:hypothetical protein
MKKILLLSLLLVSLRSWAQTDTLVHINVNKNFNYTCSDCPDSVLVVIDSLYVVVYDTISSGGGGKYNIITTSSTAYDVSTPAMYIYKGTAASVFTLPPGTDAISGLDYLFVNSGTSEVLLEQDDGTDLVVIDPGMIFNTIWNKINWNIY